MTPDYFLLLADATTAVGWTTTPKSASCLRSQRSAISARALTTWLPAAQSKHSSPRRVLRESLLPPEETKRSIATRRRLATALIRRETGMIGSRGEAQRLMKLLWLRNGKIRAPSFRLKLLLELPQVKKKEEEEDVFCCCFCSRRSCCVCLSVIWCNTQEYCCIIALRTLSCRNTAV